MKLNTVKQRFRMRKVSWKKLLKLFESPPLVEGTKICLDKHSDNPMQLNLPQSRGLQ